MLSLVSNKNPKNLKQLHAIMSLFAKHTGSLDACAKELFIHKNTLQYQLNKIKNLTGYDPRNYRDFSVLYIALLLRQ